MDDLLKFLRSVLRHWVSLVTGSVLVAGLGVWEHVGQKALSAKYYVSVCVIAVVAACYQAWLDEYRRDNGLEATVAALRHEKERSQPTQTEIAEIRTALEGLKANAHHWASRLVSGGVLARGTKPDLLPPRWTSALTIAAHFSTELHGKMLTIEDKAHHCERDIEDLCSVPESMRVSRQHQFIAVAQELSALGVQAAEAAGDLQQQRQPK